MMAPNSVYQQGDIVVVDFPFTNGAQTKRRPALVLSNQAINQTGDYLLVMITSQVKHDGLSIPVVPTDYIGQPLPLISFIRFHKLFLLNESLISHQFSSVSVLFRQTVVDALTTLLR